MSLEIRQLREGALADVFVSYKAEDRRRVRPLVNCLGADGLDVWWDAHLGGGDEWRETIQRQLDQAKCVIVVWSKRSVGAGGQFVRDEAARAQRRHIYLPIRIDDVDPPLGFGETQTIALSGWTGNRSDPRYQSLLRATRSVVSGTPPTGPAPARGPMISRRLALGGAAAAGVATIGASWFVFRSHATADNDRIAVLPFANLSADPAQAYFSDGIAEELRAALSRVGMQVIGRTSSDAVRNLDTKTAAAKLSVANILTGSVERTPQTIRVNAQLLRGSDGVERWSESYERAPGDAIRIQTDIAENVAQALSIALTRESRAALTLGITSNPAAQDLVLQTIRDASDDEIGLDRKIALLDSAVSLDPNYAEAYARKAWCLAVKAGRYASTADAARRALIEALAITNRSISIAPKMALGYTVRSQIYQEQLQIGLAMADDRRAVTMPDANSEVFRGYASILWVVGRFDEALQFQAKSMSLDPLNPAAYGVRATILYFARRYSEAADSARRALAIAPDQVGNRIVLANSLVGLGKSSEAEIEYRKLDPAEVGRIVGEAVIAGRTGQRSQALDKLQALKARYSDADHYQYAIIYSQIRMIDEAIKELELAWAARNSELALMHVDPLLDPVRSDLRFAPIERKLQFP